MKNYCTCLLNSLQNLINQHDHEYSTVQLRKQRKESISNSGMQKSPISNQITRQRSSKASNKTHDKIDRIPSRIHNKTDKVLSKTYGKTELHRGILGQKTQNKNHDFLTRKSNIAEKNISATIVTILAIQILTVSIHLT